MASPSHPAQPLCSSVSRGTNHWCWESFFWVPTQSRTQTLSSQPCDSSDDLFQTFHLLQGNVPLNGTPTLPNLTCLALPANPAWPCLRPQAANSIPHHPGVEKGTKRWNPNQPSPPGISQLLWMSPSCHGHGGACF